MTYAANTIEPAAASPARQGVSAASATSPLLRVAFFGHDWTESTVIKRVCALQAAGAKVTGFMFRRPRANKTVAPPSWDNIELGITVDRNYAARLPRLIAALPRLARCRSTLRECEIFYARNIDMLLLAVLAKALLRCRAPVVYEVLDVQRIFTGAGRKGRIMRWAERRLLKHCALLVVSSPEFIARYFTPMQGYRGPWQLLENKVCKDQVAIDEQAPAARPPAPPWVIGWFGTLRCRRSLAILSEVARRLGNHVAIEIRGIPSHEDITVSEIAALCEQNANIRYFGPYRSPADLAEIYGQVHFAWCVDYLDAGANSDWLLPNRLYEGALYGAVALGRRGTATGRMIEANGLGWTLSDPLEGSVHDLLSSLTSDSYARARQAVEAKDRSMFVDETDTMALLERMQALSAGEDRSGSANSGRAPLHEAT